MTTSQIALPAKLIPVFAGRADVRGARGGRGSGKTRSFAKMTAVQGYIHGHAGTSGIILCARQFMNSLEDSSLEEVKRAIEDEPWLADYYEIGDKYIRSRDGRIWFAFAGLDRNINSIKSKGRILLCWVDEAEPVTEAAWTTLVPTLREEGDEWNAELWITWNPKRKHSPVEVRFCGSTDPLIKIVDLNWRDNQMFPAKLERERLRDERERPGIYPHVWEGAFIGDDPNALFQQSWIDSGRAQVAPRLVRVVVGVDPSGAGDEDNTSNDAIGIMVAGIGTDGIAYVLEDCTVKAGPGTWGRLAVEAFDRHKADLAVGEANYGGAMVEFVLRTARRHISYKKVNATRGKAVRAEPFSALYEQGKIRHVGKFPELEEEMSEMTIYGYTGQGSPNRVDALIWCLAELYPRVLMGAEDERSEKKAPEPGTIDWVYRNAREAKPKSRYTSD